MNFYNSKFELLLFLASAIFLSEAVYGLYFSNTKDKAGIKVSVALKKGPRKKKREMSEGQGSGEVPEEPDPSRLTHGPPAAELSHPSKREGQRWYRYLDRMQDFRTLPEEELWNTALFFPEIYPLTGNSQTKQLMWYLQQAKVSLKVSIYSLNFRPLERCLQDMAGKGVKVMIVCHFPRPRCLKRRGVQVREMPKVKPSPFGGGIMLDTMHNKFVVIDQKAVITGSLNWTVGSITENRENVVITNDREIVPLYEEEFQKLWNIADPKKPRVIKPVEDPKLADRVNWNCWGLLITDRDMEKLMYA